MVSRMKSPLRLLLEISCVLLLSLGAVFVLAKWRAATPSPTAAAPGTVSPTVVPMEAEQSSEARLVDTDFRFDVTAPTKAFAGFTLIPQTGTAQVLLINMSKERVHSWPIDADRARLLPNGNLLVVHGTKWGIDTPPWSEMRPIVREYSWEGEVVWEHTLPDAAHHDIQRLENGNTLIVYLVYLSDEEKEGVTDQRKREMPFRSDVVQEVTPDGKVVWEWKAHEHLDLNDCGERACAEGFKGGGKQKDRFDWLHVNTISLLPNNRWYEQGDERFRPGNLMLLPRNWWQVLVVDRESKQVVWQHRTRYGGGMIGGHEAEMINPGYPGAGNILLVDNGRRKRGTFVLEINPVSGEPVWVFDVGPKFYTGVAGAAQRLPNGNTLISEDADGRIFEVTPQKEVAWLYRGPKLRINRPHRYRPDHAPQFAALPLS